MSMNPKAKLAIAVALLLYYVTPEQFTAVHKWVREAPAKVIQTTINILL